MAKILIADRDDLVLHTYEIALRLAGHRVIPVKTGAEVLEKYQAERPDLVILDMSLHDFDCVELITLLRMNESTLRILATCSSGRMPRGVGIRRMLSLGVLAVLRKPCSYSSLMEAVITAFRNEETVPNTCPLFVVQRGLSECCA